MSKADEIKIASELSEYLGFDIKFGKNLDSWGKVDCYSELSKNVFVFIEVETKQKHPCTNILKVWPYLDKTNISIFLIQVFFQTSPGLNSNRGKLGEWTAMKLEKLFPNRFGYNKIVLENENKIGETTLSFLENELKSFLKFTP